MAASVPIRKLIKPGDQSHDDDFDVDDGFGDKSSRGGYASRGGA